MRITNSICSFFLSVLSFKFRFALAVTLLHLITIVRNALIALFRSKKCYEGRKIRRCARNQYNKLANEQTNEEKERNKALENKENWRKKKKSVEKCESIISVVDFCIAQSDHSVKWAKSRLRLMKNGLKWTLVCAHSLQLQHTDFTLTCFSLEGARELRKLVPKMWYFGFFFAWLL